MCKFFNRCNYCLENSNREGGHKNCQLYNQRLNDHFQQYFSRTTEHSLRVTPQYLYHFLQLNSNLTDQDLNRLFPHIWEVFNSFYEDFFNYFQTIFKQQLQKIEKFSCCMILLFVYNFFPLTFVGFCLFNYLNLSCVVLPFFACV